MYVHMHAHMYIYMYICTYMYMHMHKIVNTSLRSFSLSSELIISVVKT